MEVRTACSVEQLFNVGDMYLPVNYHCVAEAQVVNFVEQTSTGVIGAGLTLLLPFILSKKNQWANCKLRVFAAGTKDIQLDRDKRQSVF